MLRRRAVVSTPAEVGFQDVRIGVEVHIVYHSFAAVHGCQYQLTAWLPCGSFCCGLGLVSLQFGQRLSNLPQL